MKLRVHELAKKYSVKNREFLEILNTEIGIEVTSHLANLDEAQIEKVEEYNSYNTYQWEEKELREMLLNLYEIQDDLKGFGVR